MDCAVIINSPYKVETSGACEFDKDIEADADDDPLPAGCGKICLWLITMKSNITCAQDYHNSD